MTIEQRESTSGENLIKSAIQEYKKGPLTPELIDRTWQVLWKVWGEKIKHTFNVPACDRTAEELAQLQKENRAVLLLPNEIVTTRGLSMLGKIFPEMENEPLVANKGNKGGCIDIEMDIDAPNRDTTENQLRELFSSQGRSGQLEADYIIGAQFSKLLTDGYFDEGSTFSRGLSWGGGRVVGAYFRSDGNLFVPWYLDPWSHRPDGGGRSRGVKKT